MAANFIISSIFAVFFRHDVEKAFDRESKSRL